MLPGLRRAEKKAFFNEISAGIVVGFGVGGAVLGYMWLGLFGALIGFGAGLAAGSSVAERGRFYRR
jgi:hypothetical protein